MPILHVYVDDDTMKRLQVSAAQCGKTIAECADSVVAEAAMQAVPCGRDGKPMDPRQRSMWEGWWPK